MLRNRILLTMLQNHLSLGTEGVRRCLGVGLPNVENRFNKDKSSE